MTLWPLLALLRGERCDIIGPPMGAVTAIQHQLCIICHKECNCKLIKRCANPEGGHYTSQLPWPFHNNQFWIGNVPVWLVYHNWSIVPLLGYKFDTVVFILRRCRMKYLGVRGHDICNWYAKSSEKNVSYVSIWIKKKYSKMLTTDKSRWRVHGSLLQHFFNFLYTGMFSK